MRVICVDGGRRPEDIGTEPLLTEGSIYEVETEVYGNTSKGTIVECYKLTCIDLPHVYVKNRFVVCSDGDGVEVEQEETGEKVMNRKDATAANAPEI
jgi:hypothetical protein